MRTTTGPRTPHRRPPARPAPRGVPAPAPWLALVAAVAVAPASAAQTAGDPLAAATLDRAAAAAEAARAADPADPLPAYLAGVALSAGGHPARAFDAFQAAVDAARADGWSARAAVLAALALDELLGLVAYLPRADTAAWNVPLPDGDAPAALLARRAALRLRLAGAAIDGDAAALDDARARLGCGPTDSETDPLARSPWRVLEAGGRRGAETVAPGFPVFAGLPAAAPETGAERWRASVPSCTGDDPPSCALRCGPVFGPGGPGFPGLHVAETDLVADTPARALAAAFGPDPFVLRLDGREVLAGDPAADGTEERLLVLDLPAGRHRLRLEVSSSATPALELQLVAAGPEPPPRRTLPEPTEVSLGTGLRAAPLDPAALAAPFETEPVRRWVEAALAGMFGDVDRQRVALEGLVAALPDSALGWSTLADAVWNGDLPPDVATRRLHDLLADHPTALAGSYTAALLEVGLLYGEGRADEALAALDRAAATFPEEPGPALVDAQLALDRGELDRAARALAAAERAAGTTCRTRIVAAELARARGDAAAELAAREAAGGCEPSRSGLTEALRRAGRLAAAADTAELGAATTADPSYHLRWRARLALAGRDAGSVVAAAAALADLRTAEPADAWTLFDALGALGRDDEALAALERFVALNPGPHGAAARRLSGDGLPLREDGLHRVRLHEAGGTAGDPPRLVVLDQVVLRLRTDGSGTMQVHRLVRAGDSAAAEELGQVAVPPDARIVALRTIHPDGTSIHATDRAGGRDYPLVGLEAGDYADVEYVVETAPSPIFPGGAASPAFFFAAPDEWLGRSEYAIVHPAAVDLRWDAGPGAPEPEVADLEGLVVRRWIAANVRPQPLEPWAPDAEDVLPNVRACTGCTLERAAVFLARRAARRLRDDPGMDAWTVAAAADPEPRAALRALYDRVLDEVRSAPEPADTPRSVFLRGRGDRTLLLYELARRAGLEPELWYASPASRGDVPPGLWFDGDYAVPLLRAAGTWVYAAEDFVPFGELPPNVGGRPAVRVAPAPGEGVVPVLDEPASEYRVEARVREGVVVLEARATLRGLAAAALRQTLAEGSPERLAEHVRTYAFPHFGRGASFESAGVDGAESREGPLRVFATIRLPPGPGGAPALAVPHRWRERFAALAERRHPLLLPASVVEEWSIVARGVAPQAALDVVPLDLTTPFGSFVQQVAETDEPGALAVRRSLRLPAQRIEPADYPAFRAFAAAVDAAVEAPFPFPSSGRSVLAAPPRGTPGDDPRGLGRSWKTAERTVGPPTAGRFVVPSRPCYGAVRGRSGAMPQQVEPIGAGRALICIPTYNEKENVGPIVEAVRRAVPDAHVLIVDDNSPDGTGKLADDLAAADRQVFVLHRPGKEGLGRAYLDAFRWGLARGHDKLVEFDADFSHDPKYLPVMLEALDRADVVVGSRWVPGGGTENWSALRKLISAGGSFYARTVLGMPVRDLTAGFVGWNRRVLETLDLDLVESAGFAFQIEMKYRAFLRGFRIEEIPIVFPDRRVGTSKMSRRILFEALARVWRLRFRVRRQARARKVG